MAYRAQVTHLRISGNGIVMVKTTAVAKRSTAIFSRTGAVLAHLWAMKFETKRKRKNLVLVLVLNRSSHQLRFYVDRRGRLWLGG
ncbi:hypothetical protein Q3G72_001262 [Acer saccharum]|nr:hypothetical protein Q3G72_001262 [Acer saccharum]